jgi:chromosome segregation ATPase
MKPVTSPLKNKHSRSINSNVLVVDSFTVGTSECIDQTKSTLNELSEHKQNIYINQASLQTTIGSVNSFNIKLSEKNKELTAQLKKLKATEAKSQADVNALKEEKGRVEKIIDEKSNYYNGIISKLQTTVKEMTTTVESRKMEIKQLVMDLKMEFTKLTMENKEKEAMISKREAQRMDMKKYQLKLQALEDDRKRYFRTQISNLQSILESPKVNK